MNHNKTVNIFTFHLSYNTGAILQAYALKQVVEGLGFSVRFVNILPHDIFNRCFDWTQAGAENLKKSFDRFREIHFQPSVELFDENGNTFEFSQSDIFLAGSDQVWNQYYTGDFFQRFFLDFVPESKKKIAYAPSIGADCFDEEHINIEKTGNCLQRFDAISLREKNTVNYFKKTFQRNISHVLDPVLLPNLDFSSLFNSEKYNQNNELVYISVTPQRWLKYDWIEYIGNELNMQVRVVNSKPINENFVYSHYVSVGEWLTIIHQSSFVITDSYHAMLFAILFEKPFIVIPCIIDDVLCNNEMSRFESLLSDIDLTNRIFSSLEEIKTDQIWRENIDYQKVYKILETYREFSYTYLKQSLNN